jgi:outer membrane protein TolC
MNRFKNIIRLSILIISLTSYAQNSWSLDDCVDYALTHNLKLNDLNYSTKSNKESYRQSFRELLPTVTANSSYNIQYGRSIDPNNNAIVSTDFFSNNYYINGSITIFQGFQKLNKIASSKFLYEATQDEALQEKYLLAFRVMSAFYDVQFYEGLAEISKEQVNISLSNFNLVEKQIELGLKAGADKYEAESILIGDKLLVTQSENKLKAAKLKLIQEMNLENIVDIKINMLDAVVTKEEIIQEMEVDSIYNKALSIMPIIKAQENRVKAAKKEVSFAKGNLYPSLSLSAGYGTGFFETNVDASGSVIPFNTQIKDNASQFIGLSLRIPISERWSSRSQIKQQKIALMQAANNLDIQKQELQKLIQELVQSYEATKAEYKQTKQSEASRLLAFTIAQKKYDKGLISTLYLYQSKNLYANAQNENLQVKLKLKVQTKTLDFYNGLPVFNIKTTNQ